MRRRQGDAKPFQWSCDKQAGIEAESPLEHPWEAEERGWQLDDQIEISELGFRRHDALVLDTLDVVAIWQSRLFAWVCAFLRPVHARSSPGLLISPLAKTRARTRPGAFTGASPLAGHWCPVHTLRADMNNDDFASPFGTTPSDL